MKKNDSPTMKDVANEAGVALGTVSKVFNGIPVGEHYRTKVLNAARKLGYQVNNYARGMRTNKTQTVAIIIPVIDHPFFSKLTEHLTRQLYMRNYNAMIAITDYDSSSESKCIQMVRQHKADGIIALTYNPNLEDIRDIPFISIDRSFNNTVPCITSDNFRGGQMAAQKLIELGCRRLLFLRTGSKVPGEPDKRGAGFESYCNSHNIRYTSIRSSQEPLHEDLFQKLNKLLDNDRFEYDGIFCNTDALAMIVTSILRKHHIRVPEDVQIIGFDGIKEVFNDCYSCSTIVQPVELIAKTAVDTLLNMDQDTPPSLICLPVTYGKGKTTKDQ